MSLDKIRLYHYENGESAPMVPGKEWVRFKTCLREIIIAKSDLPLTTQSLRGFAAVQFMVEVASGMKSPLFGETEVFGQFKKLVKEELELNKNHEIQSFLKESMKITKKVRHKYLKNLGESNYCSFCRKKALGFQSVAVFGTGQMSESLFPWLLKSDKDLSVYSRREINKLASFPGLDIKAWSEMTHHQVLIVATPMTSEELSVVIDTLNPSLVIDLREDSDANSRVLSSALEYYTLGDVFGQINQQREKQIKIKKNVAQFLDQEIRVLRSAVKHRPFGWDDICA